ncbi:MAG: hypothetical protein BRC35_16835 [Cyanobacteria bacterium QH_10_48_56]|nr:MAG: hypothetical protein BRC35_16835 [Cyanobacteria bacterium QH_10_48_56]
MGVFRLFLEGGGERLGSGEARRWSKDYERFPETEEAFIYSARLRCLLPKLVWQNGKLLLWVKPPFFLRRLS